MTMEQILDRFIDDAKLKCEEAQRLAVMHSNAMAALCRLRVEARQRGVKFNESELVSLSKSCTLYMESLERSQSNAKPTLAIGEVTLTGSIGFCSPRTVIRDGMCNLEWKVSQADSNLWAKIDYEGPARRLTSIRLRPVSAIPSFVKDQASDDFHWRLLYPKECVFQVSSTHVGGEFVDVADFVVPLPGDGGDWTLSDGFRTNKSKSWRLVIKSFHEDCRNAEETVVSGQYAGIEIELFEADIASDPLQRLHSLHNACLSLESLLQLCGNSCPLEEPQALQLTSEQSTERITEMKEEANKIESLYMEQARSLHRECKRRLENESLARQEKEKTLFAISNKKFHDRWMEGWWDDFLSICRVTGSEAQQVAVCEKLTQDLQGYVHSGLEPLFDASGAVRFPYFNDVSGFLTALQMRIQSIRSGIGRKASRKVTDDEDDFRDPRGSRFLCPEGFHSKCMQSIQRLSDCPSEKEVYENSNCKICKADWFKTGPECGHCKIGEKLEDLRPDKVTVAALKSLRSIIKGSLGNSIIKAARANSLNLEKRAELFFEVGDAEERETVAAWRAWRVHLDLMNDVDELNQCKRSIRLSYENEDLTKLSDDELNAVVIPFDVMGKYHEHAAKQAMALGELDRAMDTLRFLRNQSNAKDEEEDCVICQEKLSGERAVLKCGHSFCEPCLDLLKTKAHAGGPIACPLRCRKRTDPKEVMFASNMRNDDGTQSKREIKGSWGTKVTRLVGDVLDIRDLGEKGVIFSQWEDMLDIVQQALLENGVNLARASSLRNIGLSTQQFRSPDCTVLLLNVKNGAEGLTLVDATHVFLVEPLLNYGLDSQGTKHGTWCGR